MEVIGELPRPNEDRLRKLERTLKWRFQNICHLQQALTHSSFAFEQGVAGQDNEILEFLGDAVLDLAVGATLFMRFPGMREGELTRLRAALVNENTLAMVARTISLGEYILLGKGEDASRGREKASILASAYEALIGAAFLDKGYEAVASFVEQHFSSLIDDHKKIMQGADAKSQLQEKLQEKFNEPPTYTIDREEGPAHQKKFTASVRWHNQTLGTGTAKSKKEAEQQAAAEALQHLESRLPADDS